MAEKFGFATTALEVVEAFPGAARGSTAVVTGGNSGIGAETVRALARAGCAHVVLCARNVEAGQRVADDVNSEVKSDVVKVVELDLADLDRVKAAAEQIKEVHPGIDLLVLNAGVMACPLTRTKQGFEMQLGTNHIGHFLLSKLLLDSVIAAGTAARPSRVVVVSSIAHAMGRIWLDDLNYEKRWYEAWSAYGQSKLANVLFARQLAKRLAAENHSNVLVYCLHPGSIQTNLQRHSVFSKLFQGLFARFPFWRGKFAFSTKTIPEGAATTMVACLRPGLEPGSYLVDCQVGKTIKEGEDEEMMERLWDATEELVRGY